MSSDGHITRRRALLSVAGLACARPLRAFGQAGAFSVRILNTGGKRLSSPRDSGPGRWAFELVRRTSAPARLGASAVSADDPKLFDEPFALWTGDGDVPPLSRPEQRGLERFLKLGGLLVVDDQNPASGAFGRAARRELARVLPASPPVALDASHVLYKSYYIIDRPVGRVLGKPTLDAIVRGKSAQVVFLGHDLLGALARSRGGAWSLPVQPGGDRQREFAVRLAVNIAMYSLCSDYKDDQVHAPFLMRRRAGRGP
ncbi:MAG: DUF4159 domain-containing protein [Polyangiaceae bacterium]